MLTGKATENIKLPMFTDWWSSLYISVLHFHTWVTDKLKALIKRVSVYKSYSGNLIKFDFNHLCLDKMGTVNGKRVQQEYDSTF